MSTEKPRNWSASTSPAQAFRKPDPARPVDVEDDDWEAVEPWDKKYRQTWRPARPRGREDIMLDCRFSSGRRRAFGYTWLATITYEPGTITLLFGDNVVTLTGKNLERLYSALVQHRVPFIQEGNETEEALKPEDEPHIEQLLIEELEEEEDDAGSD